MIFFNAVRWPDHTIERMLRIRGPSGAHDCDRNPVPE